MTHPVYPLEIQIPSVAGKHLKASCALLDPSNPDETRKQRLMVMDGQTEGWTDTPARQSEPLAS